MLKFEGQLPHDCYVACSGGSDSMALLHFLQQKRRPKVAYFNHGTEHSKAAEIFVRDYCRANDLHLEIASISAAKTGKESHEEYWRNERYRFFHSLPLPVLMAHNLDDCIESWIFSSLHGEGKIIPYRNVNVIRPFRQTPKADMREWCEKNRVAWAEDSSNLDCRYMRNHIRHRIVPEALVVNPGLAKVIRKKILAERSE
jgi:tRNA(Ile)-lysidine synthase